MAAQTLAARVERLEERVTTLEELPGRLDALTLQVLQLRDEMRADFSAVRDDMNANLALLKEEIRSGDQRIMDHARVLYEDMKATLALLKEGQSSREQRGSPE